MSVNAESSVSQSLAAASTIFPGAAVTSIGSTVASGLPDLTDQLIGPPNWHQEVYIENGYPSYRPNFLLIAAIPWFIILCLVSAWAIFLLRRSKRRGLGASSIQALLTWKKGYWTPIFCMLITFGFAIVDDGIGFDVNFDYLGQIFLLFAVYNLLFELIRWSSLRSKWLRSRYFGNFIINRLGVCILLGVIAVLLQGMSIAYLTNRVFAPDALITSGIGDGAYNVHQTFGFLYWFAAMEVLVVSGHMVTVQRKHKLGKRKVYVTNLFVTALPLFVAASVRVLGVFVGSPPLATYAGSDNYSTYVYPSIIICAVLGPLGYISALGGITAVARNLDTLYKHNGERLDQGERLNSIDIVLMDRDPQVAHDPPIRQVLEMP